MAERKTFLKIALASSLTFFSAGATAESTNIHENNKTPAVDSEGIDYADNDFWWEANDVAKTIEIPKIYFQATVQIAALKVEPTPTQSNSAEPAPTPKPPTPLTPEEGVATPNMLIKNLAFVYGHSDLRGEEKPFSKIQYLEPGDLIKVTDMDDENHYFEVKELKLITYDFVIDGEDFPTALLQTTAVIVPEEEEEKDNEDEGQLPAVPLLDLKLLSGKVTEAPDDLNQHLALHVIAREVDPRTIKFLTIDETYNLYAEAD